jgi:hypothetical protein
VGIGRQDEHDLVVRPVYQLRGQRHGGGGVAADGLADAITVAGTAGSCSATSGRWRVSATT